MSSEVSPAGQDRGRTVEELERELAEARRAARPQQPRSCASSPARQPTCSRSSIRSCEARVKLCERRRRALPVRRRTDPVAAHHNYTPEVLEAPADVPEAPRPSGCAGRAILTRGIIHIADIAADPGLSTAQSHLPRVVASGACSRCRCCARAAHRRDYDLASEPAPSPARRSAAEDLRRPGRDRHREHAAVRGGAGKQARAAGTSNTRPRQAKCSTSLVAHRPTRSLCSAPLPQTPSGSATRCSALCSVSTANSSTL